MTPLPDTSSPMRREMFKKLDYEIEKNTLARFKLEQELKTMKEKNGTKTNR